MYSTIHKTQKKTPQQQTNSGNQAVSPAIDHRPEVVVQQKLQTLADAGPQVGKATQLQAMADQYAAQQPVQRVAVNNDPQLENEADVMGARAVQFQRQPGMTVRRNAESRASVMQQKTSEVIQPMFEGAKAAYRSWKLSTPPPFVPKLTMPIPNLVDFDAIYTADGSNPGLHFNRVNQTIYSNLNHQHLVETLTQPTRLILYAIPAVAHAVGASPVEQLKNAFGDVNHNQLLARKERNLVRRARRKANNMNYTDYDNDSPGWVNPVNPAGFSQNRGGSIMGEDHGDDRHRSYIGQNMRQIRASGITTIYNEHFRDEHQADIDTYLASYFWQKMPPNLDKFLTLKDGGAVGPGTLRHMLQQARAHGVRMVGIDSMASQADIIPTTTMSLRNTMMNQEAYARVLNDERNRGGGGYLMLVGSAHSNTHAQDIDTQNEHFNGGSPGLSQLLNIPAYQIDNFGNIILHAENILNR